MPLSSSVQAVDTVMVADPSTSIEMKESAPEKVEEQDEVNTTQSSCSYSFARALLAAAALIVSIFPGHRKRMDRENWINQLQPTIKR